MQSQDERTLLALIRAGDFKAAQPLAHQLASAAPGNASLQAMLGHVQRRNGDLASAITTLQSCTRLHAGIPAAWFDLASALLASGRHDEADAAARQHRLLAPQSSEAHYLCFLTSTARCDRRTADEAFRIAIRLNPGLIARRLRLADSCFDRGAFEEATWHYRSLRECDPALEAAWTGEIAGALRTGLLDEADQLLADALARHPTKASWLRGHVEVGQQRGIDANALCDRVLRWHAQCPSDKEAAVAAFTLLCDAYRFGEAKRVLRDLRSANGNPLLAHWAELFLPNSPVFASDEEVAQFVAQAERGLAQLEADSSALDDRKEDAVEALTSIQTFLIPYVPEQDEVLLHRHGKLACRAAAHLAEPVPRISSRGETCRIAVVSAHFHLHSASRVMRDLVCALPADTFELHGFQIGVHQDISVDIWRSRCSTFVSGHRNLLDWTQALRECAADAVLFLDLGMDSLTQALASIRHASVQMTTWGHPISSGLPTMDYFISSDLCEPDDADAHYSETLWRLPGLANAYTFLPPADRPRSASADAKAVRLSCPQNGLKLTPDHDTLFRDILAAVPDATLDLVTQLPAEAEARLQQRMASAIPKEDFRRIRFNPQQSYADYVRLVRDSDVLIDTMHWSGGLTSMDALHLGVPVVTLPGRHMRGRQTFGMLRALDIPSLVATSRDDMVRRVAELCGNHQYRSDISATILERRDRLAGCDDAVQDLARRIRGVLN